MLDVQDVECWMFRMLDVGCSGCWMLDVQDVECWMFRMLDVGCSGC